MKKITNTQLERVTSSVRLPLWGYSESDIREIIISEMGRLDVLGIEIFDSFGIVLSIRRSKNGDPIIDNKEVNELKKHNHFYYKLSDEIVKDNDIIGRVNIYYSDQNLSKKNRKLILRIILQTLILSLFIIVTVYISIKNIILDPLYRLFRTFNRYSELQEKDEALDYEVRAEVTSVDELGKLCECFNNMVVQVSRNKNQLKESERLKKEMDIARNIQLSLCPPISEHDDFEISAIMLPAEEVGGDYYDVIYDRYANLWLGIGDVSGHGLTPGLIMMMTQTVFTAFQKTLECKNILPKQVYIAINDVLFTMVKERLKQDHYMTLSLFKYVGDGAFLYTGAHEDIIIHRKKSNTIEIIKTSGIWINLMMDIFSQTKNEKLTLNPGDTMFLYTDGIIEAKTLESRKRDKYEQLDINGFINLIKMYIEEDVDKLKESIINEVHNFCSNVVDDDMTLMIIRRKEEWFKT